MLLFSINTIMDLCPLFLFWVSLNKNVLVSLSISSLLNDLQLLGLILMSALRNLWHREVRKHGQGPTGEKQTQVLLVSKPALAPYSCFSSLWIHSHFLEQVNTSILAWNCSLLRLGFGDQVDPQKPGSSRFYMETSQHEFCDVLLFTKDYLFIAEAKSCNL